MSDRVRGFRIRMFVAAWQIVLVPAAHLALPATIPGTRAELPPVSGTSETIYLQGALGPKSVADVVARYRVASTWAILDSSHWRVDNQFLEPVLQVHHETAVANGSVSLWYSSLYRRAVKAPEPIALTLGQMEYTLAGEIGGEIAYRGGAYYASKAHISGSGVQRMGSSVMLGRTADVYQIAPLYRGTHPYGRALVWLDHQYSLILRLELHDLNPLQGDPQHWIYRITSLRFGQGPSAQELAYQPPVPAAEPAEESSYGRVVAYPPKEVWRVPNGFVPVASPDHYTLRKSQDQADIMAGRTSRVDALFQWKWRFVYVAEQLRRLPLPAVLHGRKIVLIGHCHIRTGTFSSQGLHWAAVKRGGVAALALSNAVSSRKLAGLLAAQGCRGHGT